MPRNITITQGFAVNEHVMSVLSFNDEALLKLMLDGLAEAGAGTTGAKIAVQDSDFPGMEIKITGSNLSYDASGHVISGKISKITVLGASGAVVGTMGSQAAGGLAIDVVALRPIISDVTALAEMFGDWKINYSAEGVTTGFTFLNYGTFFEGGLLDDLILGSGFADVLGGSHGDDTVRGGAGNDQIDGDDTLYLLGEDPPGNDRLYGEDGADLLRGRGGADQLYGGADNDNLVGDQLGETGNDSLYGGEGDDVLWGGEGNDTLNGGEGFDRIQQPINRSGDFTYVINLAKGFMTGEGKDKLISIEGATGATYQHNNLIGNGAANVFSGGMYEDTLSGGGGADKLNGGSGDDTISGGGGADTILGGIGNDLLRGNADADLFIFADAGTTAADRIGDFAGADKIGIYQALIGWLPVGALAATAFKNLDKGAVDGDDHILFERSTGNIWVDADGSGAAERQLLATVTNGAELTAADFTVIDFNGTLIF